MPDEKRIITMTRIAIYEKGIGKEDLRLRKYGRGDYAALTLIRTFIFTSIGYAIVLGLVVLGNSEYLLENIDKMDLLFVCLLLLISYIVVLAVYLIASYLSAHSRYRRARRNINGYTARLRRLMTETKKET